MSKPFRTALVLALALSLPAIAGPPQPTSGSAAGRPGGAPGAASKRGADLVIRGAAVYTMDAVRRWAEAIAIKGDRIVYAGPDGGIADYVGARTRVLELPGTMIVPGFQDAHVHPVSGGVGYLGCALYGLVGRDAYLQAVADYAAKHPDKPWIRGEGWQLSAFAPTGVPDRRLLDGVVPDRPVYLESSDGHSAWVNSKALAAAGITKETPDPAGGRIDRYPKTGEAVGGLQDSAMDLVTAAMPAITAQEKIDGLRYALKMLNGFGITSFQDASVNLDGDTSYRSIDTYRTLDRENELTARVVASLWWDRHRGEEQIPAFLEARRKYTRDNLRATTVKIMQDGVMEVQTAAMLEPYVGKPGVRGLTMVEPEALKRAVTTLDREGFQVHFHAIGDAAIRQCLDAVEAARRANGTRDGRHHISHLELIDPADIPRFRRLDVIANFQPLWAYADDYITELTLPFLEARRARWLYPIASVLRTGAVVAFGSDWSVSSANPLEEIETAVTRMGALGETDTPFIPEERIGLADALAAFTINAAYVNFQEDRTGSIEVGKLADLAVLDRNLFTIPPKQISDAKVVLTLLGGKPVHGDLEALTKKEK